MYKGSSRSPLLHQMVLDFDPCGRYPTMSSRDMKYIFVLYDYDSNAILAAPMKSWKGADMVKAFDECYQQLKNAGITPGNEIHVCAL